MDIVLLKNIDYLDAKGNKQVLNKGRKLTYVKEYKDKHIARIGSIIFILQNEDFEKI